MALSIFVVFFAKNFTTGNTGFNFWTFALEKKSDENIYDKINTANKCGIEHSTINGGKAFHSIPHPSPNFVVSRETPNVTEKGELRLLKADQKLA